MPDALPRVFISYARADSTAFVDHLEGDLKAQQFDPWVDRHGLEGGQEWMEIIQDAIDACQALVVVLSPAAVQSQFVRMEYRYAASQGKLVIPAKYLSTTRTPIDLHILQWVDFEAGYDEGLRQLMQALSHLKAPPEPQPQPPPAGTPAKTKEQWLNEGDTHREAQRHEQALAAYDQALKLDPQYAAAHNNKGYSLDDLKRYDEALDAYDQAIRLDPKVSAYHHNRGIALWNLKRYGEALDAYDQAIKLDPKLAYAYIGRGNALDDLERFDEALVAFNQAITLDPQVAQTYNSRGNALFHLKRYREALTDFNQAIQLDPRDGLAYENKAIMLDLLERKQEAEQARQKARELGYTG